MFDNQLGIPRILANPATWLKCYENMKNFSELLEEMLPTAIEGTVVRTSGTIVGVANFAVPLGAVVEIERDAAQPPRRRRNVCHHHLTSPRTRAQTPGDGNVHASTAKQAVLYTEFGSDSDLRSLT